MDNCKINHIILSIGLVYICATLFYFITKNFQSNEILELSEKIPKLKSIYEESMKKQIKLFHLGLVLSAGFIYWFKPFQFCIIKSSPFPDQ